MKSLDWSYQRHMREEARRVFWRNTGFGLVLVVLVGGYLAWSVWWLP